mmetsp:Transcript_52611/g.107903  ORF Transcript_52611/g.107903 Transcript_52611/m.107903 type:complete len:112 (-) Transcript_52611:92-427(-)
MQQMDNEGLLHEAQERFLRTMHDNVCPAEDARSREDEDAAQGLGLRHMGGILVWHFIISVLCVLGWLTTVRRPLESVELPKSISSRCAMREDGSSSSDEDGCGYTSVGTPA